MKTIDFATLSLQDALDLAILIEKEAEERYEELAAQLEVHDTTPAAQFFRFMAANEKKHGAELLSRRLARFGDADRQVDETMLFEIEAPQYDEVRAFMPASLALQVALHSEEKAWSFFNDAIEHTADTEVRTLFEELRGEELEHQELVRRQMALLPKEVPIDVDDFVDDPVAQ
jgi:rubrerythrin